MLATPLRASARALFHELAFQVCERLDPHTRRRTTDAICTAGNAIAVGVVLDWRKVLNDDNPPYQVQTAMAEFTPDEWQQVMAHAGMSEGMIRMELRSEGRTDLLRKPTPEC